MPIHDWTRIGSGLFHHFHQDWTIEIARVLNRGALPEGYFALAEQYSGGVQPDVIALQIDSSTASRSQTAGGGTVVTAAPPRTRIVRSTEADPFVSRANQIAIRHPLGEVVSIIEVVSPGNKASRPAIRSFVEEAAAFLQRGVHLLLIDLSPPAPRDPQGLHKLIWDEFREEPFELPPDKPLTLVSYSAGPVKTAYIEPAAAGDRLPSMPVFLTPDHYLNAPLEATYETTWSLCPAPLRQQVEGDGR